jgi:hypothetical protein
MPGLTACESDEEGEEDEVRADGASSSAQCSVGKEGRGGTATSATGRRRGGYIIYTQLIALSNHFAFSLPCCSPLCELRSCSYPHAPRARRC